MLKQAIAIFKFEIFFWLAIPFQTKINHILGACNFRILELLVISTFRIY